MPFGLIFGAVASLVLSLWLATIYLQWGQLPMQLAVLAQLVLGVTLGLGLIRRQPIARWTGVIAALFFAVIGLVNASESGQLGFHVMWMTALAMFVLLVIPATGRGRKPGNPPLMEDAAGAAEPAPVVALSSRPGRALGLLALGSLGVLIGLYVWAFSSPAPAMAAVAPDYVRARVPWQDYGPALEQARSEGKPIFIDFYADWCGPCRAMDRETFRDDRVVERLSEIVAVRVDAEDAEPQHGYSGVELADKYRVMGFPTLMLLDPDGNVLTRTSGYLDARKFLGWLDEHASGDFNTQKKTRVPVAM